MSKTIISPFFNSPSAATSFFQTLIDNSLFLIVTTLSSSAITLEISTITSATLFSIKDPSSHAATQAALIATGHKTKLDYSSK